MAFTTAGSVSDGPDPVKLISCLKVGGLTNITTSSSTQYDDLLYFSAQNLRFAKPGVANPGVIAIPQSREEVRTGVVCCVQHGWEIRVRSGGHSYEGLSYISDVPFVLIDLMNLDKVDVDTESMTAWVEGGATLGQVYSGIAEKTETHGFPGGICHTVGSGGHIAGGGQGFLSRKYGLAADNVIDALLVNASGKIMNKKTMGDDVFWALRGGGGGSWGVVIAWKIKLVSVPSILTAFNVSRTGRDAVTEAVRRWQSVGPTMDDDMFVRVQLFGINKVEGEKKTDVNASFQGMYLGGKDHLLLKMKKIFPELALVEDDCHEMTWIESTAFFGETIKSVTELPDRYNSQKTSFKIKSDIARTPLSTEALHGLFERLEKQPLRAYALFSPLGGKMDDIDSCALPFPYRAGNIFDIQYNVLWNNEDEEPYIQWMGELYGYMASYVSSSPRAAYVNYLDLDLGSAKNGTTTVKDAADKWGKKYFLDNFDRLVKAKTEVDRYNYFRNSQSIPSKH
jgi:FAD/FMN-containing dehydrogenase